MAVNKSIMEKKSLFFFIFSNFLIYILFYQSVFFILHYLFSMLFFTYSLSYFSFFFSIFPSSSLFPFLFIRLLSIKIILNQSLLIEKHYQTLKCGEYFSKKENEKYLPKRKTLKINDGVTKRRTKKIKNKTLFNKNILNHR